jgi:hypothetical protein
LWDKNSERRFAMGATKQHMLEEAERERETCAFCEGKKTGECLKCLEPKCEECEGPFCDPCQERIDRELSDPKTLAEQTCSFVGCENPARHDLMITTDKGDLPTRVCEECKLRVIEAKYRGTAGEHS